jgi:hypothetical protein
MRRDVEYRVWHEVEEPDGSSGCVFEYVAATTAAILTLLGRVEYRQGSQGESDWQIPSQVEIPHADVGHCLELVNSDVREGQRLADDAVRCTASREIVRFLCPDRLVHEIVASTLYCCGEEIQSAADVDYGHGLAHCAKRVSGHCSRRSGACLDGHEVVLREVNQESELCRQHGHASFTLKPDYVQLPVVYMKDVSDG